MHTLVYKSRCRGGTLFSWNDVSQTDTVTYYALILESPSVEIQTNGDDTEFLVNHMYGASAGDSLIWKIEAIQDGVQKVADHM